MNNADISDARVADLMYNNNLIHEQVERIMHNLYEDIKGTPIFTRLMRSLEEASRRYIVAKTNPQHRASVALYNESIGDLESMLHAADKIEIKKKMITEKI